MIVHVEYTAQLRVQTGLATETFDLADGARLEALLQTVADRHDVTAFLGDNLLCFVGGAQADADHPLADGDHVTLLTPISGG
ncbi:MAG: MoaD/ThiS family protein [Kiritimatiellae bacterium]|nr:MoaD/ThiS family protein [Kiritimatiellia bacterium]